MKKALYFFIFSFLLFSCGQKHNFSVSGKIEGGAGEKIYFNKLLINSQHVLDSAKLDKGGEFRFKGNTSSPGFYVLKLSTGNSITLLLDSLENCTISGPYKDFSEKYTVRGSLGSEHVRELNFRFAKAKRQLDSLKTIYNKIKSDPLQSSRLKELEIIYTGIMNDHSDYVTSFVKKNPFSLASIYALYQKWDEQNYVIKDLQTMKIAASALFSIYPSNEQVIALYQNTLEIIRNENSKKAQEVMKQNAVNSPNIVLPDADGKAKDLWSLHGKYVLLNFWSAKDPSSEIINPVLSEIYQKYHGRGFEIFMVSVDTDREAWMEAIQQYKLNCINVGDMKGCFQAVTSYNVKSIPANYLLGTQGEIIARDIKGPALNQALARFLK